MRRRFRSIRGRSMARRPGADGPILDLSPRALRIGGWVVAFLLIAGIAVFVQLLGGDGDEAGSGAEPSASAGMAATASVTFGTALDAATGEVAAAARTDRFAAGDSFNYSVAPSGAPPEAVYVEVQRTGGGVIEIAQAPVDAQPLPNAGVIAFTVPADNLLTAFGPGEYLMLIYADPASDPLAEGTFHLVGPPESLEPSASASP